MKTILSLFALVLFCSSVHCAGETADSEAPPAEKKDHHFFVGIDLKIPYDEGMYAIEKIWNQQAQIKVDGQIVTEDIKRIKELSYARQTKISQHYAQIEDLTCEPGYSIGRDPQVSAARMQIGMAAMASDALAIGEAAMRRADAINSFSYEDSGAPPNSWVPSTGPPPMNYEYYQLGQQLQNQSVQVQLHGDRSDKPAWDQLHIKFSLKADQYFPTGHLVFIFRLKEQPEGEPTMSWFHFLSLEDISTESVYYDYQVPGFPEGRYVDSQEVFLFANGTEVATNLSPKHVEMNAADARTFVNYQYLARNEGNTRPPQRAWKYLSPDFGKRLRSGMSDESITLRIDEEGVVTDMVMSPSLQSALTPDNIREISSGLYLPALEDGKPVAGELSLRLGDLVY